MEVQGKGKYYRVYVGKFNSKEEAKTKAEQLINLKIISDYFINVLTDKDQTDLSEGSSKENDKILNDSISLVGTPLHSLKKNPGGSFFHDLSLS